MAAPVPLLLVVLAFTKARGMTRVLLLVTAPLLFVVLFFATFLFYCECE